MNKGSNSKILPINGPISLIPDNNMYANFEKIREQILKLSIGNGADGGTDGRTDGHMDGRMDIGRYIIVSRH